MNQILLDSIRAAIEAGKIVNEIYHTPFEIITKSDNTPVTLADTLSSKKIIQLLSHHNIPIISEEENVFSEEEMNKIDTFFVIDPLDGTREFIKRNGEFTINIALIENKEPVLGIVYAPAKDLLYFGMKHFGSYKIEGNDLKKITLHSEFTLEDILEYSDKLPIYNLPNVYTIITSRSHLDEKTVDYIDQQRKEHGLIEYIRMGSSLKMCLLAEGKAHEYPRFGRTMEWDTAAAHIILKEAGGNILDSRYLQPLEYHKKHFENPDFIAYAVY
ncbi:MAG: 3'(2'),5'-bisphosphate nucleotidase CysQ [Bacteroidia bacterium]|nr:MAG: 3'(2'),5'-bisphosphate nucleotidase CysQ [Bacteroidia bacterium]